MDSFFAPISPAASSLHQKLQQQHLHHQLHTRLTHQNLSNKTSVSLLEMLQRGSGADASQGIPTAEIPSIRDLGMFAVHPLSYN